MNHKETLKDYGKTWFGTYLIFVTFACVAGFIAVLTLVYDVFPTSPEEVSTDYAAEPHVFEVTVRDSGDAIFDEVSENVAPALRETLLETVYPSLDAAEHAAIPSSSTEPPRLDAMLVDSAEAHAVKKCTHSSGKVSRNTGYSRHLTFFRKHANGRHYGTTVHQVLNYYGWTTTDVFKFSVPKSYCNE